MDPSSGGFADSALVASYAQRAPRSLPGSRDVHTMTALLSAERAPADARVLVLGAGGGLELKAFATARAGRFQRRHPTLRGVHLSRLGGLRASSIGGRDQPPLVTPAAS